MQVSSISAELRPVNWYVLFVRTNQEKKVVSYLAATGQEHFLPLYKSLRQWKDRRVELARPLFPGYVFLKVSFRDLSNSLTIPGVISYVGARSAPAQISEEEITRLKCGLSFGKVEPYPYLKTGEWVVITSGVMSGMKGILLHKQNSLRVVVSLGCIERSFTIEVSASCIEPLGKSFGQEVQPIPSCCRDS